MGGLGFSLVVGLLSGLIISLIGGLYEDLKTVDHLLCSWRQVMDTDTLIVVLVIALGIGLLIGLIIGLISTLLTGLGLCGGG